MKIAYLIPEDLSAHPGLHYKITKQVSCWKKFGNSVSMVFLSNGTAIDDDGNIVYEDKSVKQSGISKLSLLKGLSAKYRFASAALDCINPHLIYSRYLFPAPNIAKVYKASPRFVLEINSDDSSEYLQKSKVTGAFNLLFRRFFLRNIDGFVFLTYELSQGQSFASYTDRRIVVANGADIEDYEFVGHTNNLNPQLIFIGSPGQSWHGVDKLLSLAKQLPDCTIHVVGPSQKSCVGMWGCLPKNVVCHGYLTAREAHDLVKRMDVGVGSLALHRKKMHEACPLKVRQYLAHGLPVIAGYKDTDLCSGKSFYLQIPNVEDNVTQSASIISAFVQDVFGKSHVRQAARNFADEHLAISSKEAVRLSFFNSVVRS